MKEKKGKEGPSPSISPAEWEVMKPIWEKGPLAARDVHSALLEGKGWSIKTVKTLLSRLVSKGALRYEQIGNTYVYHACCTREQVTQTTVRGFLGRIFDNSIEPVLAHFLEEHDLSTKEIAALRRLLDEKEKQARKREK